MYAWDGNKKAGKGEQEITGITDGQRVDVEIRFEKPFKGIAVSPITTEALAGNQTKVRWSLKGENKYPMNVTNLLISGMLGKDLETSLKTLKGILEKS